MSESPRSPVGEPRDGRALAGEPATFAKLRELTRNGYVPDTEREDDSGGILLRHDSAPDLLLLADGRIELPVGQPSKRTVSDAGRPAAERRISWRRTFLVVVLSVAFWFVSLFLAATVLEAMID